MSEFDYAFILKTIAELGEVRRVDGDVQISGKEYTYVAYKIVPRAGTPIIRIDLKEKS